MKKALIILTSFTLILLFWGCATTLPTEDGPDFYYVAASVRDTTAEARTDVFIHIPYEELVFEVANNRERQAKWDIEGVLYYNGVLKSSASGSQIETIPYDSRDDQSTKVVSMYQLTFKGTPGRYQLRVIATDRSTGKSQTRTYDISLRPILTNSFNVSDPVFLGDAVRGNDRKAAAFLDPQNLDHQKPLAFAFELYVPDAPRIITAIAHYKVMTSAGQDVLAYADTLRNIEVPREGKLITIVRNIPDTLSSDNYVFEFYVTEPATGAMSDILRKEIGFFGDWPNSPEEMKMAFTALGYIDEQAAVEIEGAKTKREKIDLFYKALATSSRLRSRGVDKREFISRLNYVNKTFSSFKKIDGWKSPRGRIYIKFGMPDNVFLFPITTWRMYNYEVWYYSPRPASGDRERLFVFVEKDGEYKLEYFPKFPEFYRFPKIPLNMEF